MQAEICPSQGVFCRTTFADLYIQREKLFTSKEILMTESIEISTPAKLIPATHFIEQFRAAIRALEGYKTHPGQATVIGIPAEQVQSFEIVLARTESKQRSLIEKDVVAAAKTETAARLSSLARLKPVVSKAKLGGLSAEELLAALNAEPDPSVARAHFMSMKGDGITMRDETEILTSSNTATLPKKYPAAKSYAVEVRVTSVDVESDKTHLILTGKALPAPLFAKSEGMVRRITTQVTDRGDLRLLNLCMAYQVPVVVELAITVDLGNSGLAYTATLIRFPKRADTLLALKQAIDIDGADLFSI